MKITNRTSPIRLICLLIVFALMATAFAACADTGDSEATTGGQEQATTAPPSDATTAEPGETRPDDEICEVPDNVSFDGETFTMLLRSNRGYAVEEFCVEYDTSSDIVDSAIFARQQKVETMLGITFEYITETEADLAASISNTAATGDYEYDIACPGAFQVGALCTEGVLGDWKEVPYIGLDKVWWGSRTDLVENLTINDKMYVISGDASNMSLGKVLCMYFNKNLLEIYGGIKDEEMYDIVLNQKWTIDKLLEISKGISQDTTGDGEIAADDLWGCNFYLATIADNYFAAFDIPIVTKNDDEYKISLNTPRMITALEKLQDLCHGSGNACYLTSDKGSSQKFFMANHAAFTHGGLEWANEMSDMVDDFGVIPYPMLDEEQEKYKATLSDVYTAFVYIDGSRDTEKLGAVMELIASISYDTTTVAYYETVLKGQSARDSASWTTIDLIHDSITYDMGYLFSSALGNPNQVFRRLLNTSSNMWASYWAANGTAFNKRLKTLVESFD